MNNIISYKQTKLNSANIKYNDYLRSLLAEIERLSLISAVEMTKIRMSLMEALDEVISVWTDGESSSVMTETANKLLMSILFNIDAYLIGLGSVDSAMDAVMNNSAIQLYYEGQRRLKLYLCESTGLLVKVKRSRVNLPNVYYNETVDRSLISALKHYDIRFGAHLSDGDIDYPLAVQSNTLRGIHFLRGYMLGLYAENEFCREYDSDEIKRLYAMFCEKHKYPLTEPRVNIYSLVFVNALFNEYLRKEPGSLMLTEDECDVIEDLLGDMSADEITTVLGNVAAKLIGGNPVYNVKTAKRYLPDIQNAISNRRLKNYVICVI